MAGLVRAAAFNDTKLWGFGDQKGAEENFRDGCSANCSTKNTAAKSVTISQAPSSNPFKV